MSVRSIVILCLFMALFLAGAEAQSTLVNPAANTTMEGNSRIAFPFSGTGAMHYQQILSLKGTQGLIRQVAFRRDNDVIVSSGDYTAFAVTLDLTLATSPNPAVAMSATFANNLGNDAKMVYSGTLNWPAQKKVPPGPTAFAYTIPLAAPYFIFLGTGDLCLDIMKQSSTNSQTTYFGMDADSSPMGQGFATKKLGESCPGIGMSEVYIYSNWYPGAQARALLWKAPSAVPAIFLAGTSSTRFGPFPLPVDLAFLGAPGCNLYTNIVLTMAGTTSTSSTSYNSRLYLDANLPGDPALSGMPLPIQFLMLNDPLIGNPAKLSVSQGWEITIGTLVPGMPPQSEAHSSSLTSPTASLVQAGYGMVVELTL